MNNRRYLILPLLILGLIFTFSCSNNSPVDPGTNPGTDLSPDRVLQIGPPDPYNMPNWSCERNFDTDNTIIYPYGYYEFDTEGDIRIREKNCVAANTKVEVRFQYDTYPYLGTTMEGIKHATNKYGTFYYGDRVTSYGSETYGSETTETFFLHVVGTTTADSMTGQYIRSIHYWYTYPDGTVYENTYEWKIVVHGVEV